MNINQDVYKQISQMLELGISPEDIINALQHRCMEKGVQCRVAGLPDEGWGEAERFLMKFRFRQLNAEDQKMFD